MSDFPGYPSPFSTWNLSTSARPVFPIGNIPVPGLVTPGVSSFLDPGYFPGVGPVSAVPDHPLSSFYSSAYRAPTVSSRFLPSITDLPALGVEPLYGCGLRDPRGIAHSPNFLFSQNPSPLTFDQIYRSSGSNSVSPVSQYRNQLDQRYVNSRLLVPGRVSEPLARKPSSILNLKPKEEKPQVVKKDKDKGGFPDPVKVVEKSSTSNQEKSKKIWNPFEGDSTPSKDKVAQDKKESISNQNSSDTQTKDITVITHESSSSINQDKVAELSKKSIDVSENVKSVPRQPIPQYPVKPIPLYESQRLALTSSSSYVNPLDSVPSVTRHHYPTVSDTHRQTGAVGQCQNSISATISGINRQIDRIGQKSASGTSEKDLKSDEKERDLNQNLHIEENNNNCKSGFHVGVHESKSKDFSAVKTQDTKSIVSDSSANNVNNINPSDVIVLSDSEEVNPSKTETSNCVQSDVNRNISSSVYQPYNVQNSAVEAYPNNEIVNNQNCFYQLQLQIEDDHSLYVPYESTDITEKQFDNSDQSHLDNPRFKTSFVSQLNEDCLSFNERPLRSECLTSPNGSVDSTSSKQHSPSKSSKSKGLLSPKKTRDSLRKKELKDELSLLSNQVNEIRKRRNSNNKDLVSPKQKSPPIQPVVRRSVTGEPKERSIVPRKIVNRCHYRRNMAAPGALTVMKSSEDSLSASISSSQVSESDSDTQLSTDNADKLFTESQNDNTHTMYPDPNTVSDQSGYLSSHQGNGSCDNQFYKSNNPNMCQTDSDNQKPYLCVQEQNRFNEKSQILPPYNCYTQNQSTNVLPSEEESFQSQHEEEISNFHPQSTQAVLDQVDSQMDYDENSVMSEPNPNVECDSQLAMPHVSDASAGKPSLLDSIHNSVSSFLGPNDHEWEFLHSKQYIDNIYCHTGSCEPVKNEDGIRESDSPKTFIDLDTTTKEKKAQEKMKVPFMKGSLGGKHYGKGGYNGGSRMGHNMYGNQYDNYGGMGGHRWNNYNRNGNDGSMGHQSKMGGDRDGNQYDQNQYRPGYQSNYYPMNQGQNGGDKMYNQSGYHGNDYSQNDSNNYYNQGQPVKGYQGNYSNDGRYDPNYYQNKPGNDYNTQGNMYPPTSTDMPGSRYNNQNYGWNQGGYNQHYTQQSPSHSGSNTMVQYQNTPNPNFSLPRNASPAGSEFPETPPGPVKKKRGRKRKADKEPHDDSKPKPNTIVQASMNIGPLIDVDNPDCPIETYDYNHQIETIFNYTVDDDLSPIAVQFLEMEQRLCKKMMPIKYGHPVNVIYCPLTYAFQTHRDFVSKYLRGERPMLFLGMNPGPYGMSQNGCPFGEANVVRDWLKITGDIYKPEIEHPKKPITGLACTRNEVSGARFWGLFQRVCRVPENFFKHSYVHNFCPFAYMSESGKNITPPQLEHSELDQINESCDGALVELVKMLNTRCIIAVGKFVQQRASKALHNAGIMNVKVECILHPSPINPHANKGWEQIVAKQLIEMNVMQYLNPDPEDVQRHIDDWEKVAQSNANAKLVVEQETL